MFIEFKVTYTDRDGEQHTTTVGTSTAVTRLTSQLKTRGAIDVKTLRVITHGRKPSDRRGRFVKPYTLVYETWEEGWETRHVWQLTARGVETVGWVVNSMGDREEAWNIAVFDSDGEDVTDEFVCFT